MTMEDRLAVWRARKAGGTNSFQVYETMQNSTNRLSVSDKVGVAFNEITNRPVASNKSLTKKKAMVPNRQHNLADATERKPDFSTDTPIPIQCREEGVQTDRTEAICVQTSPVILKHQDTQMVKIEIVDAETSTDGCTGCDDRISAKDEIDALRFTNEILRQEICQCKHDKETSLIALQAKFSDEITQVTESLHSGLVKAVSRVKQLEQDLQKANGNSY